MKKQHIVLSPTDLSYLSSLLSKGEIPVKVYVRAQGLLLLNEGKTIQSVSEQLNKRRDTISDWAKKYRQEGLSMLEDEPRSGRPVNIDGKSRAKITALACSVPPEGHGKWTLRLLSEKVVELGYVEGISHSHVQTILKKTNSSLT